MCVGGANQREFRADADLERAIPHPAEQFARATYELVAGGDVVVERRSGEVERSLAIQHLWIERRHWPTRLPEEGEQSTTAQAVQRSLERRASHRIVHDGHADVVGDALHVGDEIARRV